jgi:hypothetical protein
MRIENFQIATADPANLAIDITHRHHTLSKSECDLAHSFVAHDRFGSFSEVGHDGDGFREASGAQRRPPPAAAFDHVVSALWAAHGGIM